MGGEGKGAANADLIGVPLGGSDSQAEALKRASVQPAIDARVQADARANETTGAGIKATIGHLYEGKDEEPLTEEEARAVAKMENVSGARRAAGPQSE